MRCFVLSNDDEWKELFASAQAVEVIRVSRDECKPGASDVLFDLRYESWDMALYKSYPDNPIFISAVQGTLQENQAPNNIVRMNGWTGMLGKPILECAANDAIRSRAEEILNRLNKKVEWVADLPGLVSPRVIAMIINEAWIAFEEGVSTKQEIDVAMQLGTNYPFGPFAWGDRIGNKKIVDLLNHLREQDSRYDVAASLQKEVTT